MYGNDHAEYGPNAHQDQLQGTQGERHEANNYIGEPPMNILNTEEYKEFTAWKEQRIRQEARTEAQAEAQRINIEAETTADAAVLRQLEARGVSLAEAFGRSSTARGRNVAAILHKSDQGKPQSARAYARLRTIATRQGLVI